MSDAIRLRNQSGAILTIFMPFVNLAKTHRAYPTGCNKKPIQRTGLCGAKGIRTLDLYNAIVALSQLSYSPKYSFERLRACHSIVYIRNFVKSAVIFADMFTSVRLVELKGFEPLTSTVRL